MNIQFKYLYRDGANYKQFHHEIFSNERNLSLEEIDKRIQDCLIDGENFYCDKWGLKDLHYFLWDNEIDHMWHEFESIEETEKASTKGDIHDFLSHIESLKSDSII